MLHGDNACFLLLLSLLPQHRNDFNAPDFTTNRPPSISLSTISLIVFQFVPASIIILDYYSICCNVCSRCLLLDYFRETEEWKDAREERIRIGIFETFELVGYFPFDRDSFPFRL